MSAVQASPVDREGQSEYAENENKMARLVAERARAIRTLERALALVNPKAVTQDRIEACHVMLEVLDELRGLDPSGLDDGTQSSTVDRRLKAFRNVLSSSSLRVRGVRPREHDH